MEIYRTFSSIILIILAIVYLFVWLYGVTLYMDIRDWYKKNIEYKFVKMDFLDKQKKWRNFLFKTKIEEIHDHEISKIVKKYWYSIYFNACILIICIICIIFVGVTSSEI